MYILHTVLHTLLMELARRICLNFKTRYPWRSLSLFSSLECLIWTSTDNVIKREISFLSLLGLEGLNFYLWLKVTLESPVGKLSFRKYWFIIIKFTSVIEFLPLSLFTMYRCQWINLLFAGKEIACHVWHRKAEVLSKNMAWKLCMIIML